jgi:rare lipoprotein A (peptidoglycan hydrolase)
LARAARQSLGAAIARKSPLFSGLCPGTDAPPEAFNQAEKVSRDERVADASVSRAPKDWLIACMVAAGTAALLASAFLTSPYPSNPDHGRDVARMRPAPVMRETAVAKLPKKTPPVIEADLTPPAAPATEAKPKVAAIGKAETGRASWYKLASATASGESMDADDLTAAHPSLPIGTRVLVENLDNGRSVVVRINDRGPFTHNRIIDVSEAAAEKLGMVASGIANVRVSRIETIAAGMSSPR